MWCAASLHIAGEYREQAEEMPIIAAAVLNDRARFSRRRARVWVGSVTRATVGTGRERAFESLSNRPRTTAVVLLQTDHAVPVGDVHNEALAFAWEQDAIVRDEVPRVLKFFHSQGRGLSPGMSSLASLGKYPGFARGRRWCRGHRFLNFSFASLTACRSALRRSFVASASRSSRSCTSVSWRLACAIHLSMYSIHVGTSSSELRNVNASSSNRTPAGVAIIAESFAPRKDCRQRIDGGALRGTRHVTRSCVFGGPTRLTFMERTIRVPAAPWQIDAIPDASVAAFEVESGPCWGRRSCGVARGSRHGCTALATAQRKHQI